jgi:4-amino-4-deoxy-L-arabinose transferase-like glycosyltransferase
MEDAFQRDRAAWSLAQSEHSLFTAFTDFRSQDQYGGMLFINAAVYRIFGGETHAPLLMVVITSAFSSLAVAFSWAFTRRIFNEPAAKWAAWGLALFPEAILLGSAQMREAIMMPLAAAALYGIILFHQNEQKTGLAWIFGAFLISLPISPPLSAILIAVLSLVALGMNEWKLFRNWQIWAALGGMLAIILTAVWLGWEQIAPRVAADIYANPVEMLVTWVQRVGQWQAYVSEAGSGKLQALFARTPDWFNVPFLIAYGVGRPLLPPALTHQGVPVWQGIAIFRAVGWTLLLPILLYTPIRALRRTEKQALFIGMTLAVWLVLLAASFWGGGDLWDNPRYRVSFIGLQMALAGWVLASERDLPVQLLKPVMVTIFATMAWFIPWYIDRHIVIIEWWPDPGTLKLLGIGVFSGLLYGVWEVIGREQGEGIR